MKNTPVIIAVLCGIIAFLFIHNGNVAIFEGGSSSKNSGRIKVEQMMTENRATKDDTAKLNLMKQEGLKALSEEEYDWKEEYRLNVTTLLHCVNSQQEFDHNIYAFDNGNEQCLIVVCHGWTDGGSRYGILMHEQYREDYVQAVEESLAYWTRKGVLQNAPFEFIVLTTCHSGYAQPNSRMPIFGINLQMANDNKNMNAFLEREENGQTVLYLFRGTPRTGNKASTDTSDKRSATKDELANMTVLGKI